MPSDPRALQERHVPLPAHQTCSMPEISLEESGRGKKQFKESLGLGA